MFYFWFKGIDNGVEYLISSDGFEGFEKLFSVLFCVFFGVSFFFLEVIVWLCVWVYSLFCKMWEFYGCVVWEDGRLVVCWLKSLVEVYRFF